METKNKLAWRTYERDRAKLTAANTKELAAWDKKWAGEKQGIGEDLAAVIRYGKAILDTSPRTSWRDNPPDQFKNVHRAPGRGKAHARQRRDLRSWRT